MSRQVGDQADNRTIELTIGRSNRQSDDRADNRTIEPTIGRSNRHSGDRTDTQAIELSDEVNLKKQGKFCRKGSVTGESAGYRTSEIGEVGPPLRLNKSVV
ncbi:hypothetical protein QUA43_05930 [Microcoleus sp. N9_B4]|uniref:hypothetical protein n=1 Tax=Microcoleus sp. N9_B4 TaxID=3055386 RepID=UPI002FD75648